MDVACAEDRSGLHVALAGKRLEPLAIDDAHVAGAVIDDAPGFEPCGRLADAWPRDGEHLGERLVRQAELVAPGAVLSEQQPAREPLRNGVIGVAGERASREMQPEGAIAEQRAPEAFVLPAQIGELLRAQQVPLAGDLHRLARTAHRYAEQQRHPYEAVAPDD